MSTTFWQWQIVFYVGRAKLILKFLKRDNNPHATSQFRIVY